MDISEECMEMMKKANQLASKGKKLEATRVFNQAFDKARESGDQELILIFHEAKQALIAGLQKQV